MLEQPKIIIISKFYQTHAKISKPTGATAPGEKVKEISSRVFFQILSFLKTHKTRQKSLQNNRLPRW